jgi:hypothetical protein
MNESAMPVTGPVRLVLPDGEVITVDGVPYDGWGTEAGKWYQVIQRDDDGNELWRRWWSIPASQTSQPDASAGTPREDF